MVVYLMVLKIIGVAMDLRVVAVTWRFYNELNHGKSDTWTKWIF